MLLNEQTRGGNESVRLRVLVLTPGGRLRRTEGQSAGSPRETIVGVRPAADRSTGLRPADHC